jgi:hypothetical protein
LPEINRAEQDENRKFHNPGFAGHATRAIVNVFLHARTTSAVVTVAPSPLVGVGSSALPPAMIG